MWLAAEWGVGIPDLRFSMLLHLELLRLTLAIHKKTASGIIICHGSGEDDEELTRVNFSECYKSIAVPEAKGRS